MYLDSAKKKEIFEKHGQSATDTGSVESQVALFTYRIAHLTEHLKSNRKDFATARALKMLVGKRRRLLDYVAKKDIERYRKLIAEYPSLIEIPFCSSRGGALRVFPRVSSIRVNHCLSLLRLRLVRSMEGRGYLY